MTEKEISGQKKLKSALGQYELSFEEKFDIHPATFYR